MLFPAVSCHFLRFLLFPAMSSYFWRVRTVYCCFPWSKMRAENRIKIYPKSTQNRPQICLKSLKNRAKIAPKWHPGAGVDFWRFFITFWTPFWTHFGPVFDQKMTSKTYRKSHAKMFRKRYAFGRFRCPFWGPFLLQMPCIFRTLFKHRFWACVLHVSLIFRTAGPSKNTVFLQ